jgi:hypothetical protein
MAKAKAKTSVRLYRLSESASEHDNSNVWNILPLTTFRTIDLAGKKNSNPLFSRFCAETRVFFEVNYALKFVQMAWTGEGAHLSTSKGKATLVKYLQMRKISYDFNCANCFFTSAASR